MLTITMKTDSPREAVEILQEALEKEMLRLKYGLNLARKRLKSFEKRYNVSSETFMNEWRPKIWKARTWSMWNGQESISFMAY